MHFNGAKITHMEATQRERGVECDANDSRNQREFFVQTTNHQFISVVREGGTEEWGREGESTQNKLLADVEH